MHSYCRLVGKKPEMGSLCAFLLFVFYSSLSAFSPSRVPRIVEIGFKVFACSLACAA
jgi:hypothetical protein